MVFKNYFAYLSWILILCFLGFLCVQRCLSPWLYLFLVLPIWPTFSLCLFCTVMVSSFHFILYGCYVYYIIISLLVSSERKSLDLGG